MKAEEKNWHEKLKKLNTEEQDAKEAMDSVPEHNRLASM